MSYIFLRLNVFPLGMLIWENFPNVSCLRTYHTNKRRDSFDPRSLNLLREDIICMVNLLEIPRMVVFFVNDIIEMLRLFQKRSCVLSSYNENQDVATISTLSDQFNLSCK